ncbi:MAG: arsenic resistance N-acetyltransferase ArsN2 [Vicinamibacterales bacterium]
MSPLAVAPATIDDREPIRQLLASHGLPHDGLLDHWSTTLVARAEGQPVGSAALEVYPDGALLRSVAVAGTLRGTGVGRALTESALRLAADLRVPAVYLLTTTAETYFPRFGFERIDRDAVPPGVRSSIEFTSACPASAVAMRKRL